jgi:FMN phosphatase YigB (HAD superfamily)
MVIKALIFDIDDTLITYNDWEINKTAIFSYLSEIKQKHHFFMAVASFNDIFGISLMDRHYPNLFDCIMTEKQQNYDNFSKKRMLQIIRKEYTKFIKTQCNRSSVLRWEEMIFFDDNDEVLSTLRHQCPKLRCIPVNDKTGITVRHLKRIIDELFTS